MDRQHGTKYDVALSRIVNGPTFEAIPVARETSKTLDVQPRRTLQMETLGEPANQDCSQQHVGT